MASPQITPLLIRLGIEGFEGVDRLSGAFRNLSKTLGPSADSIDNIRRSVLAYAETAGRTEVAINGTIDALRGLQSQVERGSSTWNELTADIERFRQRARATDSELATVRQGILRQAAAHTQSANSIRGHIESLQNLRAQASLTGNLTRQLGDDIERLSQRLNQGTQEARTHYSALNQALAVRPQQVLNQWRAYTAVLRDARSTAEQVAEAQERLRALSGAPRIEARRAVNEAAAIVADPQYQRRFGIGGTALEEMANVPAALSQRLRELQDDLNSTTINTELYLRTTLEMANVQRQAQATTQGLGAALAAQLRTGEVASSQRNLQTVIGQLRNEMLELDTTTREGAATYAANANQVRVLEQRLRSLASAYSQVSDAANQVVARAPEGFINPVLPSGARNPEYVSPAERTRVEAVAAYQEALDAYTAANNAYTLTVEENAARRSALEIELADEVARKEAAALAERTAQEDRAFKRELERIDILRQQRAAASEAMGLRGPVSGLYSSILGLSTADVTRQQELMGRTPTTVFNDLATAFNKGGLTVDLKSKSTQLGQDIASGVSEGLRTGTNLDSAAKSFADRLIRTYKAAFRIQSPSKETEQKIGIPLGEGIGQGIIKGLNGLKGQISQAIFDATATPQRVSGFPAGLTPVSDAALQAQGLLARTTDRPSVYRGLTRILGESALTSAALPLAQQRRAYESGGVIESVFLPPEARRGLRGTAGIPGAGVEQAIIAEAVRRAATTGAFVGPLAGPQARISAASALGTPAGLGAFGGYIDPYTRGQRLPLYASAAFRPSVRGFNPLMVQGAYSMGLPAPQPLQRSALGGLLSSIGGEFASMRSLGSVLFSPTSPAAARTPSGASPSATVGAYIRNVSAELTSIRNLAAEITRSAAAPRVSQAGVSPVAPRPAPQLGLPYAAPVRRFVAQPSAAPQFERPYGDIFPYVRPNWMRDVWLTRSQASPEARFMAEFGGDVSGSGGAGGGSGRGRSAGGGGTPAGGLAAVNNELVKFGDLNKRSIADVRALGGALGQLREQLSPLDADYAKVNKRLVEQERLVGRELERRSRSGRRMTGMQLAQAGGAAISGGIFGGPEGFLGGVIGTPFGVGGAFAGAAIGAQVGMVRQSIGEMAAYAAEIRKQRIAIQGVVSSFEDYRTAIQTTEAVANRFNVPLQESTQRFTSLSAAVLGSGGTITQARDAFNNITAAIIATGGGAEQVNAALTATSQVFSKGQVTAEELRGQLGERLPGAFSLFADSMGVSTQQLNKLLEQGKVGLPEFNKFLSDLGIKFGATADRMTASSEQAGARMERAFENLRITVGDSLGTTGAYFQDFATSAIKSVDSLIDSLIKLRVLTPGPNYFVNQVVSGELSMEQLQQRRRELARREPTNAAVGALQGAASVLDSPLGRVLSPIIGTDAGALSGILSSFGVSTGQQSAELKAVNEAIDKLNVLRQNTNKDRQKAKDEADAAEAAAKAKERENQAKQLLDLIDQREEQLAEARTNREEQLAEIRKNAIRKAADLERSFADDRLRIERDIRDIRTRSADTSIDNALRLREAMGEDKSIIETEREVIEIFRRERDTLRAEADRRADEERTQARTIADYQRDVSESINKANETYAKRIGEIQTKFAQQSAKLIEEASGRGAARIAEAAKLMAFYTARTSALPVPSTDRAGTLFYNIGGKNYSEVDLLSNDPNRTRGITISDPASLRSAIAADRATAEQYRKVQALEAAANAAVAPVVAAPTTSRPTYATPALPGAAATTTARTQRGEETGTAAETQAAEERDIAFASKYTELIQLRNTLERQSADLRARTIQEARGYTREVATSLVDLNNTITLSMQNLKRTKDKLLEGETDKATRESIEASYIKNLKTLDNTAKAARNLTVELANQNALLDARQDMRFGEGLTEGVREYTQSLGTLRKAAQQLAGTGLKGIESAIVDLSTTGTTAFREFANSIIKDTIRVITQQLIMRSVLSLFNLGGPQLQPAPFNLVEIERYSQPLQSMSQGGIASGPTSGYPATLHGNEAVIPLSGSRSIPVEMRGGSAGTTNIVINVEAGTSSTEGPDAGNVGQELARDLARVVDDRLVYHRRPGGLLSGTR